MPLHKGVKRIEMINAIIYWGTFNIIKNHEILKRVFIFFMKCQFLFFIDNIRISKDFSKHFMLQTTGKSKRHFDRSSVVHKLNEGKN